MTPKTLTLPAAAAALILAAAGCGSADPADGTAAGSESMQVVAGFYPLEFLAERVGGDLVSVSNLAQPGAEPHDLELAPQQVQEVAEADLVLYLSGFQPALDDAVSENAQDSSFDALEATDLADGYEELGPEEEGHEEEGHEEGEEGHEEESGLDPHVWLDPTKYGELAGAVAEQMAEADPDNADTYAANADALIEELAALDEEFVTGLADCERNEIVVTHNAFGYLAEHYDLEQVPIAGLSPEEEPSAQRLAEIQEFAAENGVTTIFYEEAVSPEYAQTVADEVGAATAVLSPIEVASDGEDYISLMQANLTALQEALGCA